jgi:hypothetical protein
MPPRPSNRKHPWRRFETGGHASSEGRAHVLATGRLQWPRGARRRPSRGKARWRRRGRGQGSAEGVAQARRWRRGGRRHPCGFLEGQRRASVTRSRRRVGIRSDAGASGTWLGSVDGGLPDPEFKFFFLNLRSSKIETVSSGTGRVKYSVGENVDSDRQSVERGFGLCARARDGQMGLAQSSYDLSQFPLQSS